MINAATAAGHQRPRNWLALRAWLSAIGLASLVGCAQVGQPSGASNQQPSAKEQEIRRQLDYAGSSSVNKDVSVVVLRTLLPGDEGYFPKTTAWAEYVFELKTFGSPISIQSAAIVTKEGAPLLLARSGLELLEAPKVSQEIAKSDAVYVGAATGGMALGAAIPFIGPILMAGAYAYNMGSVMSAEDKVAYDKAFRDKAGLNLSHLETNARIVRSVFFPMVPDARSVVVDYKKGVGFTESGRLEIPLRRAGAPGIAAGGGTGESARAPAPESAQPSATAIAVGSAAVAQTMSMREAQEVLQRLGYSVGTPDGVAGRRTVEALRRYQKEAGLPATGKLDAETINSLKAK